MITAMFLSLAAFLPFQDPAAPTSAKEVLEQVNALGPKRGDKPESAAAAQKAVAAAAKLALKQHDKLLATGEGLFYRGQLQLRLQDHKSAVVSFLAHAEAEPDSELANQSLFMAATFTGNALGDPKAAIALIEKIDLAKVPANMKQQIAQAKSSLPFAVKRNELNGSPAPEIHASHVLNSSSETFSLASLRGKVVVVDFFATWCPPCRAVIPDLVKMQQELGPKGLQVLSVTKFYGNGMDFNDPSMAKPHGGKSVREMDEETELTVNKNFIKAFDVNYPFIFAKDDVGSKEYFVRGIPTVFVIGRDGKIVGHVVGAGDASHKKLHELVETALGAKIGKVEAAGKKGM